MATWNGRLDSLACGGALGQVHGAGNGSAVKPSVGVDTERFALEFLELDGPVDGLEQREKA